MDVGSDAEESLPDSDEAACVGLGAEWFGLASAEDGEFVPMSASRAVESPTSLELLLVSSFTRVSVMAYTSTREHALLAAKLAQPHHITVRQFTAFTTTPRR